MNSSQRNTLTILVILVIILGASSYYFFTKYNELKNNPNAATEEEVAALVEEVGKLILLPADEVPTVATVADPSLLADQPFFANAEEGDRVLIYAQAQKAILYSPSRNQVVEVAPVNIGEGEVQGATTEEAPAETSEETSTEEEL
ncbi:MAG: hypothetical protein AAB458_02140 [Patescibacteria group bacterium]